MKILECEQGSYEWFKARLGRPSASRFHEFITPLGELRIGKGSPSATMRRYALELVAERLTAEPTQHFTTAAMDRGTELEPKARKWYTFSTGRSVRQVGFMIDDSERWGASPDGLSDERGLEIKCPLLPAFMDVCESGELPDDHMLQVQAGLWISGLSAWDYCIYTDARGIVPQIIEVLPDNKLHEAFDIALPKFCDWLDAIEKRFREQGHGWKPEPDNTPTWEELIGMRTTG